METNTEKKLKIIKSKILKLVDTNLGLIQSGIKNDCEGYLYCITNSLFNVYNIQCYKIGNTMNLTERLQNYNVIYFEPIEIKQKIEVPYKFMFETLLFKKLINSRVRTSREFFTNYDSIENEFNTIKNLVDNNDSLISIEKYYDHVMNNLYLTKFTHDEILNLKNNKQYNKKYTLEFCNRINYNLKIINYFDKYKNKINNYSSNKKTSGYILHIDIPEITYNFDKKVQVIMVLKNKISNFAEFVSNIKIFNKININDVKFAKLLLHDMLNNTHIKNKYFLCSFEKTFEAFEQIKNYFDYYSSVDKIKKTYFYDKYNEGIKIKPDINPSENSILDLNFLKDIKNNFTPFDI